MLPDSYKPNSCLVLFRLYYMQHYVLHFSADNISIVCIEERVCLCCHVNVVAAWTAAALQYNIDMSVIYKGQRWTFKIHKSTTAAQCHFMWRAKLYVYGYHSSHVSKVQATTGTWKQPADILDPDNRHQHRSEVYFKGLIYTLEILQ